MYSDAPEPAPADAFAAAAIDHAQGPTPPPGELAVVPATNAPPPRKYPLATDFKNDPLARAVNGFLDSAFEVDNLAAKCLVGEAAAATLAYYGQSVDVHPLAQLMGAGLAFGIGVSMARAKPQEKGSDEAGAAAAADLEARLAAARKGGAHTTE